MVRKSSSPETPSAAGFVLSPEQAPADSAAQSGLSGQCRDEPLVLGHHWLAGITLLPEPAGLEGAHSCRQCHGDVPICHLCISVVIDAQERSVRRLPLQYRPPHPGGRPQIAGLHNHDRAGGDGPERRREACGKWGRRRDGKRVAADVEAQACRNPATQDNKANIAVAAGEGVGKRRCDVASIVRDERHPLVPLRRRPAIGSLHHEAPGCDFGEALGDAVQPCRLSEIDNEPLRRRAGRAPGAGRAGVCGIVCRKRCLGRMSWRGARGASPPFA